MKEIAFFSIAWLVISINGWSRLLGSSEWNRNCFNKPFTACTKIKCICAKRSFKNYYCKKKQFYMWWNTIYSC